MSANANATHEKKDALNLWQQGYAAALARMELDTVCPRCGYVVQLARRMGEVPETPERELSAEQPAGFAPSGT